jgi:hypothetical protein
MHEPRPSRLAAPANRARDLKITNQKVTRKGAFEQVAEWRRYPGRTFTGWTAPASPGALKTDFTENAARDLTAP